MGVGCHAKGTHSLLFRFWVASCLEPNYDYINFATIQPLFVITVLTK